MKLNYALIPLFAFSVAYIGSWFARRGTGYWYRNLKKPEWTPRGRTIGNVWTVIYLLSAASALIVWNSFPKDRLLWIIVFGFVLNGILNFLWNYVFFVRHYLATAIFEAIALELTVLLLIPLIWLESPLAAGLLIPYAAWVPFATFLAFRIWALNHKHR